MLGGLLGILLMMIPLRAALNIKDQHGLLKYPEGTACAQVLIAGASKESREASHEGDTAATDDSALQGGKIISIGFIIGFIYKSMVDVFSLFKDYPEKKIFPIAPRQRLGRFENNPALPGKSTSST